MEETVRQPNEKRERKRKIKKAKKSKKLTQGNGKRELTSDHVYSGVSLYCLSTASMFRINCTMCVEFMCFIKFAITSGSSLRKFAISGTRF